MENFTPATFDWQATAMLESVARFQGRALIDFDGPTVRKVTMVVEHYELPPQFPDADIFLRLAANEQGRSGLPFRLCTEIHLERGCEQVTLKESLLCVDSRYERDKETWVTYFVVEFHPLRPFARVDQSAN